MKQARECSHRVEPLGKHHDLKHFTCGVAPLDRYLHRQASQDIRRGFATVFVGIEGTSGAVHGYYTLSLAGVPIDLIPEEQRRKMPRYPSVPAVRLRRLAVATAARGQGLGTLLLVDSLDRSLRTEVAWAAFIVDAKDDQAGDFYRQFGFQPFLDDKHHLFLSRGTVEKLFE